MNASVNASMLFSVERLSVAFRRRRQAPFVAVQEATFTVHEDETVALVGESGSGKSVTALAMMGLLPKYSAEIADISRIIYQGRDLLRCSDEERRRLRGTDMAMIFQEPMTSLNPVFTIGYQIAEVLRLHKGMSATAAQARCVELLDEVGLPEPRRALARYPSQLSGGQQQRAMIAMALACTPRLLIADEPTTALDVTVQKQIVELLKTLKARHRMSVLFISHDLALVGELADRIIVMRNGEIREAGETERIFSSSRDRYTQALLQCRPRLDDVPLRLPTIDDFMAEAQSFSPSPPTPLPQGERGAEANLRPSSMDAPGKPPSVSPTPPLERGQTGAKRKQGGGRAEEGEKAPLLLEVSQLKKSFFKREGLWRRHEIPAVKSASFTLRRGETLGIVGESGCGKTTLGLTLLRLHQATSGAVRFDGQDILALSEEAFMPYRRRMQIVFQNPYASLNPRFTVGQSLIEPILLHRMAADRKAATALAFDWLHRVGLDHDAFDKYPHEFSGGQRQRIALARALTVEPELLICDEPVSALDVSVQAQILNLLKDLQEQLGVSYLFISHDLAVVRYLCDTVMVMRDGDIVETSDVDSLYRNPQNAYTRQLLSAVPRGRDQSSASLRPRA
ncbi:MAG: dipeptide ABC transporter ATP-binding protein [Burkholderiales bacterium]|jgi:peptide/nickel transport system ATP-binding protein|nr:dipeptide ABC transporter ATP-binding protein [Burkholderiales bacterium]